MNYIYSLKIQSYYDKIRTIQPEVLVLVAVFRGYFIVNYQKTTAFKSEDKYFCNLNFDTKSQMR